jgi:hypothetical protein
MYASSDSVASFSVLRLEASALDDVETGAGETAGYLAQLASPSGVAAARGIRITDASSPYDFIVVEYRDTPIPYTRAWVRHLELDDAVSYSFFTETPAPFPLRSFSLDALQPREAVAVTGVR